MVAAALNLVPASAQTRSNGHATQSSESKRVRLKNAVFIEDFTSEALRGMRESLSFDDPSTARDNALALASAVKSWDTATERVRILKGEPLPGNRKPLPDTPKKSKPKLRPGPKAPERPPAPTAEVPSVVVSGQATEPMTPTGSAQAEPSK